MTLFGYARASSDDQELDFQIDALLQAGCKSSSIYTDRVTGARAERPGLSAVLNQLSKGDVFLVWRLDRLGRSMPHLVNLVDDLRHRGIDFRSLSDNAIDTSVDGGQRVFDIFSSLARFEQSIVKERTRTGLKAARARGKLGGRKRITADDPRVKMAKKLNQDKGLQINDICDRMQISRSTFYRLVNIEDSSDAPTG